MTTNVTSGFDAAARSSVAVGALDAGTRTAVVVGNPKGRSRTYAAATHVARELAGREPDLVIDLADYGGAVLSWQDAHVQTLVEQVAGADLAVHASPTYKAAYTGLLKAFLDRFPSDGLRDGVAVPLMLGAGPGHSLAVETGLRPVLAELDTTIPAKGLYVIDAQHDDPAAYADWLSAARPVIGRLLGSRSVS